MTTPSSREELTSDGEEADLEVVDRHAFASRDLDDGGIRTRTLAPSPPFLSSRRA